MKRSWRTRWLLAPLALAILHAPGAIATAAGATETGRATEMKMSLPGSHGYRIEIEGIGRVVELKATKRVGAATVYATYAVHGRVGADRVEADFGDVGHLSLKFRPAFGQPSSSGPCVGRRLHLRGHFTGTIRFRGEQGFSSLSAKRAKGSATRLCATESAGPHRRAVEANATSRGPAFFETELAAVSKSNGRSVSLHSEVFTLFDADGKRSPTVGSLVSAELEERRGRMEIDRAATVSTEPMAMSAPGVVPVTASLAPPTPFNGTGSYREEAGAAPSWTGDLSIDLPGAPDVPLAGPDFRSILCSGKSTNPEFRRCQQKIADLTV